jgi:hypothetical protein
MAAHSRRGLAAEKRELGAEPALEAAGAVSAAGEAAGTRPERLEL